MMPHLSLRVHVEDPRQEWVFLDLLLQLVTTEPAQLIINSLILAKHVDVKVLRLCLDHVDEDGVAAYAGAGRVRARAEMVIVDGRGRAGGRSRRKEGTSQEQRSNKGTISSAGIARAYCECVTECSIPSDPMPMNG